MLSFKKDTFKAFDYPSIAEYFDFIHFQSALGFNFSFKNELESRNIHDLEHVITRLIELGLSSTKILIEVNFGGPEFHFPLGFSEDSTNFISIINDSGYICFKILFRNYNIIFNSVVGVGVAEDEDKSHILLFENSRVIANKMRFAIKKKLGGTFINRFELDDNQNRCNELNNDTYDDYNSLVTGVTKRTHGNSFFANILNEAIIVALNEIDQENNIIRNCD